MSGFNAKNSIAKKIIISIILVSSVITCVFTAFSFYLDYNNEMNALSNIYEQIRKSYLKSLSEALWDLDNNQMDYQLSGILNIHDVTAVKVVEDEEIIFQKSKNISNQELQFNVSHVFDLTVDESSLSKLEVVVSKYYMYNRLAEKALYFFISQGLKTFVVSILIFLVFQSLVSNHIVHIVDQIQSRKRDPESYDEITLKRRTSSDELTFLVDQLNRNFSEISKLQSYQKKLLSEKDEQISQQQLKVFNAAKLASIGEMAGGVAHEINNPLAIISGNVHRLKILLSRGPLDKDKMLSILGKMDKMVHRISAIIQGLKYISYEKTVKENNIFIDKIINSTLDLCNEKFKSRGVTLNINIIDNLQVHCNEVQISQIILNLLNNAYDAIKGLKNPVINLTVKEINSYLVLSVSNSGPKIDGETAKKIFQPFFTTKPVGKGTGLGLSISKGIAESHNGDLSLNEDENLTTFELKIPA